MLASSAALAQEADVQFDFYNAAALPQGLRFLYIIPEVTASAGPHGLITRDRIIRPTPAGGSVVVSNLVWGDYRAEFVGLWSTTTNWFSVPYTNPGTRLNVTNLVKDPFYWAACRSPTYSRLNLFAGTNIVFRTNGPLTYVDALAGTAEVVSFNGRTGLVSLTGEDITIALDGVTPVGSTNTSLYGGITLHTLPDDPEFPGVPYGFLDLWPDGPNGGSVGYVNWRLGRNFESPWALYFSELGSGISFGFYPDGSFQAATVIARDSLVGPLNGTNLIAQSIPTSAIQTTNAPQAGYYLRVDGTGTNLYYSPD